jgi:multiple antibiotic resistance protein
MPPKMQIFAFLFLMLGPFKIVGPFVKLTQGADPKLTRQIAVRAIIFSSISLLLAAILGARIMSNLNIPLPILSLSGGIILFLVALLNIIKQFSPATDQIENVAAPNLNMAINPLAFPVIVTPYGIAAVIVFLSLSPDLNSKLTVGVVVLGIMILNLIIMLITRYIYKALAIILAMLGAILGIVQVALGLNVMYNQFRILFGN